MSAGVANILTYRLRKLASNPSPEAAAAIRQYLEAERQLKLEHQDHTALTLLHHGRQRLNVV